MSQPPSPAKLVPTPAGPPANTPPPANVPWKAQVGRPARVAKPKTSPQAAVTGPKKTVPPKPPVTRGKEKNQIASKTVAVTNPENETAAPVDAEYDTDELAEFPTDFESELVESEPGDQNAQNEEQ